MTQVHSNTAIIGGSFAGLTAAMHLARGRRTVTLFDTGITRNRFANHAHGLLGQDGQSPDQIRLAGRAEVLAYPTVTLVEDQVLSAQITDTGFDLKTASDQTISATQVILAHGMTDILPDIPGLAPLWGQTALQCPYCHGYEVADRPTAVLMTHPMSAAHARLYTEWTRDLMFLSNGYDLTDAQRQALDGITIIESPVTACLGIGPALTGVQLQDGRVIPRDILYLAPRNRLSCDLALQLGCALTVGPFGDYITIDQHHRTSVPGVFAAGDVTRPFYNATFAAADGIRAATACHQSMVFGPGFFDGH
jgi:thioredoxin reductase